MAEKHKLTVLPIPLPAWLDLIESLTVDERSAFTYLIASYCRVGYLPNDDRMLAQIARIGLREWLKMKPRLAIKFPCEGWRWPEIDQAIERRTKIVDKRAAAGAKGNYFRWQTRAAKRKA